MAGTGGSEDDPPPEVASDPCLGRFAAGSIVAIAEEGAAGRARTYRSSFLNSLKYEKTLAATLLARGALLNIAALALPSLLLSWLAKNLEDVNGPAENAISSRPRRSVSASLFLLQST